jgi:ATP-binding cassette, subfamily B, bacterial
MEKEGAYYRLYEAQTRKLDDGAISAEKPRVPFHREHAPV